LGFAGRRGPQTGPLQVWCQEGRWLRGGGRWTVVGGRHRSTLRPPTTVHRPPPRSHWHASILREGLPFMIDVKIDLDFACCTCGACVGVTLKCAGKGLAGGAHAVAAVKVPCPDCCNINHLYFEPSGTIHAVRPCKAAGGVPRPSLN